MAKRIKKTGRRRQDAKSSSKERQPRTESYDHPTEKNVLRPDVGTQAQFRKKKGPVTYKYDSSISPAMDWDEQNPVREEGEALIAEIAAQAARLQSATEETDRRAAIQAIETASQKLKAISKPFLNWAGKAEGASFEVPTLPLFVHERLSTEAIIETLKGHKRDKQLDMFDLFADPQHSIADQVLKAYEHKDKWVNRMILGDSLVVMNSLVHYESMGRKVQMIYIDPPYGVKFGSNFQPFVRRRDVKHNDDEHMTREPEMVQAYRDTWEQGLHTYLTYLRDRLLLCRELLAPTGSIFVQISDENLHHVRDLMDEVFDRDNYLNMIPFVKTSGVAKTFLPSRVDFLLWYARDKKRAKYNQVYLPKSYEAGTAENYNWIELADGSRRGMTAAEKRNRRLIPENARVYKPDNITTQGNPVLDFEYKGIVYRQAWKTTIDGLKRLAAGRRLHVAKNSLQYVRYITDFPWIPITQLWGDTATGSFTDEKIFAVQTGTKTIERCVLMATDPGDLVLDPTCGSGTTAYVAERWGRRWITIDVSRVPMALAREKLLTRIYPWFELRDEERGPGRGFVYKREGESRNPKSVGPAISQHITLKSIAKAEPPQEEIIVDRPERDGTITRVTGPFVVEATIPTPVDWEGDGVEDSGAGAEEAHGDFVSRMLEVLRRSPVLRLPGRKTVALDKIRRPAKSLSLSGEAVVDATAAGQSPTIADAVQEAAEKNGKALRLSPKPVALVFGPENGSVSENLVYEAAKEAAAKKYTHLYVIGFAIQPNARKLVDTCDEVVGVPAAYVQATPDIMMGDLLKNMRSSQIFSVCGLPEVELRKVSGKDGQAQYEVELVGLDVFDPATMATDHRSGDDVPAWFLDTNYNGLCFHVCQAFFPRTKAWDSIKKALRVTHEEGVWDHLAGTVSAPFDPGDRGQIAVKVIDDRGNELLVVKSLEEAE